MLEPTLNAPPPRATEQTAPVARARPSHLDHPADSPRKPMVRKDVTMKLSRNSIVFTDASPCFRLVTNRFIAMKEMTPVIGP